MVSARLWPARLADSDDPGDPVTGLRSFFLINVHSPVESVSVRQKCTAIQQAFEDLLQRDEKFYDSKEMFVSVLDVDASMLPVKLAAAPEWIEGDVDPLDDLDEEELGRQSHSSDENQAEVNTVVPASVKSAKKKKHRDQETHKPISPETSAKLRTSIDIYNRLLW
ncbi:MAG TPA: hypothetical protein VGO47_14540, partial [Chlamydiales bacterium]|nr:hypothetical protein [Chlamydiales bacterium]